MFAVQHAERILDWQDNLMSEEVPPQWMWHLEHELEAWFEEVERKRKERYGGGDDEPETVPMMQNEYAKGVR